MMNSGLRYFKYRLSSTFLRIPIMSMLIILYIQSSVPYRLPSENSTFFSSELGTIATVVGILFTLLPILELAPLKNRRNIDTLFSIPVSRHKMAMAHYFCGLAEAAIVYTVTFIYYTVLLAPHAEFFRLGYLVPYFFVSLLMGICIYSVVCFVFGQANSAVDGVIFTVMYMLVFWLIAGAIFAIASKDFLKNTHLLDLLYPYYSRIDGFLLYNPLDRVTTHFMDLLDVRDTHYFGSSNGNPFWFIAINQIIVTAASIFGFLFSFGRLRAEKIGGISDSWFGYRLLIPVYGVCLLISGSLPGMIFSAMIVGYIIYRRSFKLKMPDIITFCVILGLYVLGRIF